MTAPSPADLAATVREALPKTHVTAEHDYAPGHPSITALDALVALAEAAIAERDEAKRDVEAVHATATIRAAQLQRAHELRVEAVIAERDETWTKLMDMHTWGEEWKVKARTSEARVVGLEKALREIADSDQRNDLRAHNLRTIARAALRSSAASK